MEEIDTSMVRDGIARYLVPLITKFTAFSDAIFMISSNVLFITNIPINPFGIRLLLWCAIFYSVQIRKSNSDRLIFTYLVFIPSHSLLFLFF